MIRDALMFFAGAVFAIVALRLWYEPRKRRSDRSGACLAETVSGNPLPRCDNYPRCMCGGPHGWKG